MRESNDPLYKGTFRHATMQNMYPIVEPDKCLLDLTKVHIKMLDARFITVEAGHQAQVRNISPGNCNQAKRVRQRGLRWWCWRWSQFAYVPWDVKREA